MSIVPTPRLSTKIATGLDIAATLAVEHIGTTFQLPVYHPIILGVVSGLTFALFAWKDQITGAVFKVAQPFQNKNTYNYHRSEVVDFMNKMSADFQRELNRKRDKKPKEVYLFAEPSKPN